MKALIFSVASNGQMPDSTLLHISNIQIVVDGIFSIREGSARLWKVDDRTEACLAEVDFGSLEMRKGLTVVISEGYQRLNYIFTDGKVVDFERVCATRQDQLAHYC